LYNKICNLLDIEVQEIKSVEKETEDETTENETDHFDTSDLMKTTGGNVAFFNQMIDTFVTNAKDTSKSIRRLAEEDNWEEVGQRAHKAIPSFRYFKLHNLVNDLTRLEELGLHQKNFAPMPPLAQKSAAAIDTLIEEAKNYKLEE
jgi:HPt (histidine-containing phosphotransfer) domain-containing protein